MAFKMNYSKGGFPYKSSFPRNNDVEVELNEPESYITIDGYKLTQPQYERYEELKKVGKGNKYLYTTGIKDPDSIVNQ